MYCSSRPESYLEVLPSKDQDDLITKNKGRQRASESRLNFHIGGPHIQCIFVMYYTLLVILMKYESYKMTHIYNKEDNDRREIQESLIGPNFERRSRDPRTADLGKTSKRGDRDPRTAESVRISKWECKDPQTADLVRILKKGCKDPGTAESMCIFKLGSRKSWTAEWLKN